MPKTNEDKEQRPEAPEGGMSTGLKAAIVCAAVAGVFVVVVVGAIIIAAFNAHKTGDNSVAPDFEESVTARLDKSGLSDLEKEEGRRIIRRFVESVKAQKIPPPKFKFVVQKFMQSSMGQFSMIRDVLRQSDLPEPEKKASVRKWQLFAAVRVQEKLSDAEIAGVMDAIPRRPDGEPKEPPWTEAELRNLLIQVDNAVMGKNIELGGDIPVLDDDLRQMIRAMKEAMVDEVRTMSDE